ncbi:hypothetical protein KC951_01060 [Candidatus Saccharibacteria bacterium]|nr:hypothetical protein [Candidatus Saccharibacteria bacterium]
MVVNNQTRKVPADNRPANSESKWWQRRAYRLPLILITFLITNQLEYHPELNPFGSVIVIINAVLGLWIWAEILLGIIGLILRLVRKMGSKSKKEQKP